MKPNDCHVTPSNFDDIIDEIIRDIIRIEKLPDKTLDDTNESLVSLCVNLETVFKNGLKSSFKITSLEYNNYWHFFKDVSYYGSKRKNIDCYFSTIIKNINNEKSLTNSLARGRLAIRSFLKMRMLSNLFKFIRENEDVVKRSYMKNQSFLTSSSFLMKIEDPMKRLETCKFSMNLLNSDFLEISWYLPIYQKIEFVPCKSIGISIRNIHGHHFIETIDPFGVAGENENLNSGDILSRIFDSSIKFYQGQVKSILDLHRTKPIKLWICKCYRSDGHVYQPIMDILTKVNMTKILNRQVKSTSAYANVINESDGKNIVPITNLEINSSRPHQLSNVFKFRFVGKIDVGNDGSIEKISECIGKIFNQSDSFTNFLPVSFKFSEINLEVFDISNGKSEISMYNHAFSRISSCGRRTDIPRYFAYIVGNTSCAFANSFEAIIFEAHTENDAKVLTQNIADGFERTHWTV